MLAYSTPIPRKFLERQMSTAPIGQLYRVWNESGGALDSALADIADHLCVLENTGDAEELPPIMMAGKHTLATAILSADWSFSDERQKRAIPKENRDVMRRGYLEALSGELSYRQIAHEALLTDGESREVFYEQFIAPFHNRRGMGFFMTVSVRLTCRDTASDLIPPPCRRFRTPA